MLGVATFEVSNPVIFFVLMESDYLPLQRSDLYFPVRFLESDFGNYVNLDNQQMGNLTSASNLIKYCLVSL